MCGTPGEEGEIIDVSQPLLDLTEAIEIVEKLDVARKNHQVQLLRRNVNALIKKFHYMENSLLRKRKYALEHTGMAVFRQEYRHVFEKARRELQREFNKLKKLEFSIVLDSLPAEERPSIEKSLQRSAIQDYSVYCLFSNTFGPLKFSFWK
jgi:hypothetical protein